MVKVDLKSAYRMVPVHPEDRKLLGMQWKDHVYIDTCLPFGLRSAPRIFTEMADMLEWCAKQQGVSHLMHYLDDYITWGRAGSLECEHYKACLINTCDHLGVLVAQEKCQGPATTITYLGIEIDSLAMELRLPEDKLRRIRGELGKWTGKKAGRRRELESLLGLLQHASKIVRPGRRFVRRIIKVMTSVRDRDRFIRLNADIRSDLLWWHTFIETWNGVGILQDPTQEVIIIESDASGNWDCAAIWESHWLQWQWNFKAAQWHISPKELLPILLAVGVWGNSGQGRGFAATVII